MPLPTRFANSPFLAAAARPRHHWWHRRGTGRIGRKAPETTDAGLSVRPGARLAAETSKLRPHDAPLFSLDAVNTCGASFAVKPANPSLSPTRRLRWSVLWKSVRRHGGEC